MSVRQLSPHLSARHFFGAELRFWRELREHSQNQLAKAVHVSEDLIRKVECGDRWPTERLALACDTVLDCSGSLVRLQQFVESCRASASRTPAPIDNETIAHIVYRVLEATSLTSSDTQGGRPWIPRSASGGQVAEVAQLTPRGQR